MLVRPVAAVASRRHASFRSAHCHHRSFPEGLQGKHVASDRELPAATAAAPPLGLAGPARLRSASRRCTRRRPARLRRRPGRCALSRRARHPHAHRRGALDARVVALPRGGVQPGRPSTRSSRSRGTSHVVEPPLPAARPSIASDAFVTIGRLAFSSSRRSSAWAGRTSSGLVQGHRSGSGASQAFERARQAPCTMGRRPDWGAAETIRDP